MPVVRMALWEGRTADVKPRLAAAITHDIALIAGCDPDHVTVIFEDVATSNWASGGTIVSERRAQPPGTTTPAVDATGGRILPPADPT